MPPAPSSRSSETVPNAVEWLGQYRRGGCSLWGRAWGQAPLGRPTGSAHGLPTWLNFFVLVRPGPGFQPDQKTPTI
jgi:hypothetical protein